MPAAETRACARPTCTHEFIARPSSPKKFCSPPCAYESRYITQATSRHIPRTGTFAAILRGYREARGRSRNTLALEVGVDTSYLVRIEQDLREPPHIEIVEALARGLHLTIPERDRLLVAAGYTPPSLIALGGWDETLSAVVAVLNDRDLSDAEKEDYRTLVRLMSERFRPSLGTLVGRRVAS